MGAEQSRNGAAGGVPGGTNGVPPGVSTLGPSLQKRFSKGIQYNMKVVIKGDRNVGKTCLFYRLQGQTFKEEYVPTQEIQVACIQWNYKATDDVVKVEIWDIVDKGKVKKRDGLKMDTEDVAPTLDAEFIDVYKGTSGVIMMLDITKYWTYEYVQRELNKVPEDIPVIIMGGHRDLEENRAVLSEEVHSYISELNRPKHAAAVYYMEASMKDGFGLKYLYRFFNVPFLELQRQTLLAQLRRNEEDLEAIKVELDVHEQSEEQDYDQFRELLERKRRGLPTNGVCTVAAGANETAESASSVVEEKDVADLKDGTAMSLRSRLSEKVLQNTPLPAKLTSIPVSSNQSIDNFVPDGNLDSNFLNNSRGPSPRPSPKPVRAHMETVVISDSEDELTDNPQVAIDQESPDEDDKVVIQTTPSATTSSPPQPLRPSHSTPQQHEQSTTRHSPSRHSPRTNNRPSSHTSSSSPKPHRPWNIKQSDPPVQRELKKADRRGGADVPSDTTSDDGDDMLKNTSVLADNRHISDEGEPSDVVHEVSVIHMEPAPLQPINPISLPSQVHPISTGPDDDLTYDQRDEILNSTPREHVTRDPVTRDPALCDTADDALPSRDHVSLDDVVVSTPHVPHIDLDVLDKVSCAPPIATKKQSPRETKKRKSDKKVPPKKSLLDINLTSSEDDDCNARDITDNVDEVEEKVDVFCEQVVTTYEEPPTHPPPPTRLNSTGSLKLTHSAFIPDEPEPAPEEPAPLPTRKEKKKKKTSSSAPVDSKMAEEIRQKKERDELEEFFGGPQSDEVEVKQEPTERPKKKKKKKKQKNAGASNNPGADEYEQF